MTEAHAYYNMALPKVGLSYFYDTVVLKGVLVFQITCSGKMPRLRQYPVVK